MLIKKQRKTEWGWMSEWKAGRTRELIKTAKGNAVTQGKFMSRSSHRVQWYLGSFCLSVTINDKNFSVIHQGDLVGHQVWELQTKQEVSRRLRAFSFSAKHSWCRCSDALKAQQKPNRQTLSSTTEDNILDFSRKAIFLFPRKTFQWVIFSTWNEARIFSPLQIQPTWSRTRNQPQAWLHVFQHRQSSTLHLHYCFLYRAITAVWPPAFSPHLQWLTHHSRSEIFWKS